LSLRRQYFDLVKLFPILSGNENAISRSIVCNTIEGVFLLIPTTLVLRRDTLQVDPAEQFAGLRIL
jgi:hypothetical protein